jgi:hypothetical protein
MKSTLYVVIALLVCSAARAAAPTSESIEKLLVVTNSEKMVGAIQGQVEQAMKAGMAQAFRNQKMDADAQQLADALGKRMTAELQDELSWDKLKPIYVQVYSETFTQEEIDGLIAFYESAAGKAFVAKMPIVMQKTMGLMQQRMGPMMQKMQKAIQDTVQEVQAAKANKENAPQAQGAAPAAPTATH